MHVVTAFGSWRSSLVHGSCKIATAPTWVLIIQSLQVLFAILLRPKPGTKIRPLWNVVHHTLGYAVIILAIVNIFEGLHLLGEGNWRRIYIAILAVLGLIAIVMELITWFHWIQKRDRRPKRHSVLVGDA